VNPEAGYRGITAFIVERGTPGFSVGKKEDKLGIRASSTCELLFEQCHVSRANVLGEVGKGYKVAIETLNEGRIGIGAQMLGIAQAALDHSVRYTKERKQFGKAVAEFQGVQFELARAAMEVEAARRRFTTRRGVRTRPVKLLPAKRLAETAPRKLPGVACWRTTCSAATGS
jgi:alkylation response protein AidB-like acyl-CoA dehydrogenase